MRALLFAALLLSVAPARAGDVEKISIQPHLAGLRLGDGLRYVQRLYPPARNWPATRDTKLGVTRYRVDRGDAKIFPPHVLTLYLGFRRGDLVEIEAVYDDDYSRGETYEQLAADYEDLYGAPHRSGDRFWWDDGTTVLRVFPAEIPENSAGAVISSATAAAASMADDARSVIWRTGAQIFLRSVFAGG